MDAALPSRRVGVPGDRRARSRPARLASRAAGAAALAALAVLAVVALGWVTGHRVLVDRGDSMYPALSAGDLLVNRRAPARKIRTGEIVTFEDRRLGRSVTHRVVERHETGGRIAFVTRGDANTGVERWSAAPDEAVGRLVASTPKAGFVVGYVTSPVVRLVLTAVCAVALCVLALRWIWRGQ